MMKRTMCGISLLFSLAALPLFSFAYQAGTGNQGTAFLTTDKGNRYTAGGNVDVTDPAAGDLYVAGGNVSVMASTTADLVAAGGTINVNAPVGDDARIVGGNLTVNSPVGGDLLVAGGQVTLAPSSSVGGEAILMGGAVTIDGTIAGPVHIRAEKVVVNGTLRGALDVEASSLTFSPSAVVAGAVTYKGAQQAQVENGAQVGNIQFSQAATPAPKHAARFIPLFWIFKFLFMLVAALVIYFLFARKRETAAITWGAFGMDVLRGFVLMVVIPIAIIVAFVTIVGAWIGFAGFALLVLFSLLAVGYMGIIAGRLLNQWFFHRPMNWMLVFLGVLALELVGLIPFVGWIVYAAVFLMAFGALFHRLYIRGRSARAEL